MLYHIAALALFSIPQTSDCNNTTYREQSLPGIQPSSQVLEPCPGGSFQVTVKLNSSGVLEIVGADVEGSFTVTIQLPTSCVKSYIEHSGEIHECFGELDNWNCNPRGDQVDVKYWKADSPCPNPVQEISEFLSSIADFNPDMASIPLYFPCNAPEDATDELDPSARVRNTARINKCSSKEDEGTVVPAHVSTVSTEQVGGSNYARVLGSPAQVDMAALSGQSGPVAGSITVTGLAGLFAAVHGSGLAGDNLGQLMRSIANQDMHRRSIEGTQASIRVTEFRHEVGTGTLLSSTRTWAGSASCNIGADASYVLAEVVVGPEGDVMFTEHTVARGGDFYTLDLRAQTGCIHLGANGAASRAEVTSLRHIAPVRAWLVDPYSIPRGPAIGATEQDLGDHRTRVVLAPRLAADPGQPGFSVLAALVGLSYDYVVDSSGSAPRVVSLTICRGQEVVETREYSRYYLLEGGAWRPGLVEIEEIGANGTPVRAWELYTRGGRASTESITIDLPQPPSDQWTIQLN